MPKKSKKQVESMNSRIQLVMRSGKALLGYKQSVKSLRNNTGEQALGLDLEIWGS